MHRYLSQQNKSRKCVRFSLLLLLFLSGINSSSSSAQQQHITFSGMTAPEINVSQNPDIVKWKHPVGDFCSNVLINSNQVIVFGHSSLKQQDQNSKVPDGTVVASFDRKTAAPKWITSFSRDQNWRADLPDTAIRTFASLDNRQLAFVSNQSTLECLEIMQAGKELWKVDLKKDLQVQRTELSDTASRIGGVVLYEDTYYVVTGHGAGYSSIGTQAPVFLAVDATDGKLLWSKSDLKLKASSGHFAGPTIIRQRERTLVVFPGGDCYLYGYDTKDMQSVWTLDCNHPRPATDNSPWLQSRFFSPPAVAGDTLLVTTAPSFEFRKEPQAITAYRLDEKTAPQQKWRWSSPGFQATYAPLVVQDDIAYARDVSGSLFAIDIVTGKTRWQWDSAEDQALSPLAGIAITQNSQIHNHVFTALNDRLYVISSAEKPGCTLALYFEGATVRTTPRIDHNELFVVAGDNLYCLSLSRLLKYESQNEVSPNSSKNR